MKTVGRIFLMLTLFILLTSVTQVGGIIYLLVLLMFPVIDKRVKTSIGRAAAKVVSFVLIYLACTVTLVPLLAKAFGRVRLPIYSNSNIRPVTLWTCLLNRNYVRPELRKALIDVADKMACQYPGTVIHYLDANFPFINKFPLPPHLSHNDGKKLDIALLYKDSGGKAVEEVPSPIGYGICEEPTSREENMPAYCEGQGYWQYNLLRRIVPQTRKSEFQFDATRTRRLVNYFAANPIISRMFLEPHLRQRLQLTSTKIKFHGCQAVRHDDHLHVQIR